MAFGVNGIPLLSPEDATTVREADFEQLCLRLLPELFPRSFVFPFKSRVLCDGEVWRPDIALVDGGFAYWYILEVETEAHSLQKHVLPQVRAFRDGELDSAAANIVSEAIGRPLEDARTLIAYAPRYVGVVSNWPNAEWRQVLRSEGVQFLSIQSFRNPCGQCAYLTEGVLSPGVRSVGYGLVLTSSQTIKVPAAGFWQPGAYRIVDLIGEDEWTCVVDGGFAWLSKRRGMIQLPERSYVMFILRDDGSITMDLL
jgi:hypothetical protein